MSTGSREFDASGDLLDWGTWGMTTSAITLACWVYFDSFPGADVRLISKASGTAATAHDWMLGYSHNSGTPLLRARAFGSSDTILQTTGSLSTGAWTHVAMTVGDGVAGNCKLYVNGSSVSSGGVLGTSVTSNSNAVYVGNQPTATTNAPRGRIADAAVWSRALSSTEIGQLAALTHRPSDLSTNLEAYLSGGDLTDSSGNGRNASNTGTTLSAADPGFTGGGGGTAKAVLFSNFYRQLRS